MSAARALLIASRMLHDAIQKALWLNTDSS